MTKINSVKEIKKIIDKFIIPGYQYKTNFSSSEFLVDIESKLIIIAKTTRINKHFLFFITKPPIYFYFSIIYHLLV